MANNTKKTEKILLTSTFYTSFINILPPRIAMDVSVKN